MAIQLVVLTLAVGVHAASAAALTFKVPAASKQCFHEDIEVNKKATVQFVVVAGGVFHMVMTLKGPNDETIYQGSQKQFDTVTIIANVTGTYTACFSNEFSILKHKHVYINFHVDDESQLRIGGNYSNIESSFGKIRDKLNAIVDYQTFHRLREAQGRKVAEHLNEYVFSWSSIETLEILLFYFLRSALIKRLFS